MQVEGVRLLHYMVEKRKDDPTVSMKVSFQTRKSKTENRNRKPNLNPKTLSPRP